LPQADHLERDARRFKDRPLREHRLKRVHLMREVRSRREFDRPAMSTAGPAAASVPHGARRTRPAVRPRSRSGTGARRDLTPTSEPARWRLLTASGNAIGLRFEDDAHVWCQVTAAAPPQTATLTCPDTKQDATLRWTLDGDRLRLEGTFGGKSVTASLTRRNDAEAPLLKARFRWTDDD